MEVETFEVTEVVSESGVDCTDEQISMIHELGLKGQSSLVCGDEEERKLSPYRQMTKDEAVVYQALCPTKTSVLEFSDHVIPLRVMQVIAHANTIEDAVGVLEIWSPESSEVKDPVLVGRIGESWSSTKKYFLLARWGEMLQPFQELRREAFQKLRSAQIAALEKIAASAKSKALALRSMTDASDADGPIADMASMPTYCE